DAIVLDLRFVHHVFLDALLAAGGVEDFLFERGVDDELLAHLFDERGLLLRRLRILVLREELFDFAVIGLEQLHRALWFGRWPAGLFLRSQRLCRRIHRGCAG